MFFSLQTLPLNFYPELIPYTKIVFSSLYNDEGTAISVKTTVLIPKLVLSTLATEMI